MPPGFRPDWLVGKSEADVRLILADAEAFALQFASIASRAHGGTAISYRRAARVEVQRIEEAKLWLAQRPLRRRR